MTDTGPVRIGRRRFIGTSLAAAGAALIPPAATARSRPAARKGKATLQSSYEQLPLRSIFPHLPAIPVDVLGSAETIARLLLRFEQEQQAKQGLTHMLTLGGQKRTAYEFLFGSSAAPPQSDAIGEFVRLLQEDPSRGVTEIYNRLGRRNDVPGSSAGAVSLEHPSQFSLSWTYFPDVYAAGRPHLHAWSESLTDADSATRQFWPLIAGHGFGYNLIIPQRVTSATAGALRAKFGRAWTAKVRAALAAGNLYVIDLSRFEMLASESVNGAPRFTPATVTLLTRSPRTKSLTPVAIAVSGSQGAGRQVYTRATATEGAWLYALQAAKASVTLYGVWLGHVYHWHIVTAAMQMTMFNTFSTDHPVYQLLSPQSNFAIPFDDVLLALWSEIAPPTSLTTALQFLALSNDFATGRSYFDDDPTTTIQQLGLRQRDFTVKKPWDKYPVVQRLLTIWNLVKPYVETFVTTTYASDAAVAADTSLQAWIAASGSTDASTGGNVQGLPAVDSRDALSRVLTSLLYRITAHGISRLNSTANPALTFTANFPHCLQRTDIPSPRAKIGTPQLLDYLPNVDTISQAVTFYFTFAYSPPYVPFIPLTGIDSNLFFSGGASDPRNQALITLRKGLAAFISDYQPDMPQRYQWPLNIET